MIRNIEQEEPEINPDEKSKAAKKRKAEAEEEDQQQRKRRTRYWQRYRRLIRKIN